MKTQRLLIALDNIYRSLSLSPRNLEALFLKAKIQMALADSHTSKNDRKTFILRAIKSFVYLSRFKLFDRKEELYSFLMYAYNFASLIVNEKKRSLGYLNRALGLRKEHLSLFMANYLLLALTAETHINLSRFVKTTKSKLEALRVGEELVKKLLRSKNISSLTYTVYGDLLLQKFQNVKSNEKNRVFAKTVRLLKNGLDLKNQSCLYTLGVAYSLKGDVEKSLDYLKLYMKKDKGDSIGHLKNDIDLKGLKDNMVFKSLIDKYLIH